MSKKLLAALIAFAMVGAFGCDEEGDEGGESCVEQDVRCNGNVPQVCVNGSWIGSTDCGALGCNTSTGKCNTSTGGNTGGDNTGGNTGGDNTGGNTGTGDCAGQLTEGGNVGDPCNRNCYKQTCTNDGANALVCWDDVVTQWNCASTCVDAGYNPEKPLQVNCPKTSGGGSDSGETCTEANSVGTCAEDGATAEVCYNGYKKTWTCYNNYCKVNAETNVVSCPKDEEDYNYLNTECTGDGVTENGNVGDCCDQNTYVPSGCDAATNSGTRCDSQGKVAIWSCNDGKTCDFDPNSTEYPGGKYSCI